ncbi:MAG: phage head closure protein [Candidatus Nanopelagicales bacterium]
MGCWKIIGFTGGDQMRAGALRKQVVIQQRTETTDATFGGVTQTWTNFATDINAAVESLSGREFLAAQAAQSEASVQFIMRYVAGVDARMRIVYNGLYHNIVNITDIEERHRELLILAKAGVNEG